MDERTRHRQFEEQFLGQLRNRATALSRGKLPADRVVFEHMPEGVDSVRAALARMELYDRELLDQLPGTRTTQLRFLRSHLGGLLRTTIARLRAQVLAPLEQLARGQPAGPVGREAVLDALARYEIMPRSAKPTAVVFASATGFTESARALVNGATAAPLILMGGRADGGWDVDMPDALRKTVWAKLFEFETQDDQLKRLLAHLDQTAATLDSAGVPLPVLAEKLGLPPAKAEALVRRACRTDPRLMTVVLDGTIHVCRTPLAEEGNTMTLWSRIRKLLRMKPTVAERVREMTAQRVRLEQQRQEIDQKLAALEAEEVQQLQKGASASTDVERKQAAGRLMRIRRELRRNQAQANVLTQQIDILGTHVHHLTLREQGRRLELPSAQELTREAAEAEQVMTELAANADLVAGIEVGAQSPAMAEEEAAIFEEFKQAAASKPQAGPAATPAAAAPARESAARSPAEPARSAGEPPPVPGKSKARPELG